MTNTTRAVRNGRGTQIVWSVWIRISAGVVVGVLLATGAAALKTYVDVQILRHDVRILNERVTDHIQQASVHEDADQKRRRIYDEIQKYHAVRPQIIDDDDDDRGKPVTR